MDLIDKQLDLSFVRNIVTFNFPMVSCAQFKDFTRKSTFNFGRLQSMEFCRQPRLLNRFQSNEFYRFEVSVIVHQNDDKLIRWLIKGGFDFFGEDANKLSKDKSALSLLISEMNFKLEKFQMRDIESKKFRTRGSNLRSYYSDIKNGQDKSRKTVRSPERSTVRSPEGSKHYSRVLVMWKGSKPLKFTEGSKPLMFTRWFEVLNDRFEDLNAHTQDLWSVAVEEYIMMLYKYSVYNI